VKLLFALDNFDHGRGGAEKSAQALARMLAAAGHDVAALQAGEPAEPYQRAGATVHTRFVGRPPLMHDRELLVWWQNRRWAPAVAEFLHEHGADLVFTQHRLSPATVRVARAQGVPVVTFVRAYSMVCPIQFAGRDALSDCDRRCFRCVPVRQKLKYPLVRAAARSLAAALRQSCLVIANSEYVRRVIERFYGIPARVLYPPVSPSDMRVERGRDADGILFVKPQAVKGLEIFEAVARALPDERLLVAGRMSGRVRARLASQPNVACLGWVEDMREAYRKTRLLLGPAQWPEPFGRVFVEAAASGIPSVASRIGGIPEAVGDGGVLVNDRRSVAAWVSAIRSLRDRTLYERLSQRAQAHAQQFAPERLMTTLRAILRDSLGIDV